MSGRTCSYPRVSTACIYMMFKVLNRKCGLICSCRVYIACYLPKETDLGQKRPLFAFIHGGGWSSSKIFADQPCWQWDHLGYPARYFADKGFLSVRVDYRHVGKTGRKPPSHSERSVL